MVARKISRKEVEAGLKLSTAQRSKVVENMLMSEGDKNERAMANPRQIPEALKEFRPNGKGERRGGRQKGTPNKVSGMVRDEMVAAAEAIGYDGKGLGGLKGFLIRAYMRDPVAAAHDLTKLLGYQIKKATFNNVNNFKTLDVEDIISEMKSRGLPVEHLKLFEMDKGRALEDKRMKEINPEDRPRRRERAVIERE